MEEVWKDIALHNLHHDLPSTPSSLSLHRHHRQRPDQLSVAAVPTGASSFRGLILQDFLASAFNEPLPPSAPEPIPFASPTLTLDSGQYAAASRRRPDLPPRAGILSLPHQKRAPDPTPCADSGGCDRRQKRMIKNRESAARSRARKQAYTNELELEVAQLAEENARLKRQHEQLKMAMAAHQTASKRTTAPHRASSAPF
ncbi:Protein FD [Apostasia shenzhenica]|uniref:Protein FD n=1 Tax=Apostasia shenzhenica TaxID=1088818 RepID=A0A2H9ZS91_9ASPA|nr:Protein FD [Apostasia shenzhenica]